MKFLLLILTASASIASFVREETSADLPTSALTSAERLTDAECLETVDSAARNLFETVVKLSCENRLILKGQTASGECSTNWLQYIFTATLAVGILLTMELGGQKSIEIVPPKFVCTTIEEVQIEGEITKEAETPGLSGTDLEEVQIEEKQIETAMCTKEHFEIDESEEKEFEISVLRSSFIKTSIFDQYDFVHCSSEKSGRPRCYSDPRDRRLFVVDPVRATLGEISPEMSEGVQMDDKSEDNSEGIQMEIPAPGSTVSKDESQFDKFEEMDFPVEPETEVFSLPQTEEPGMNMDINLETKINERKPMVFVGGIAASTTPLELVQEFKGQGFNVTVVPRIRYGVSFGFCPDLVLCNQEEKDRLLSMGRVWVKDRWADVRQYIPKDEPSTNFFISSEKRMDHKVHSETMRIRTEQIEAVSSSACTNSESPVQEPPTFVPFDHSPPGFPNFTNGSNPTSTFVPMFFPSIQQFSTPYYGPDFHPVMAPAYNNRPADYHPVMDTYQQY